jgi:hypothetical protein
MADHNHFHSLVSLADCKTILGIDDREDAFCEFLLVSSTYAIEEYCMRRLLYKRVKEWHTDCTALTLPLKEYPVREILIVESRNNNTPTASAIPEYYTVVPETGSFENVPFLLHITPTHTINRNETIFIKYLAGYKTSEVPPAP